METAGRWLIRGAVVTSMPFPVCRLRALQALGLLLLLAGCHAEHEPLYPLHTSSSPSQAVESASSPPSPARFSVGGSVSGLKGTGLVLRLNGGQDLAISADGSFVFPQQLEDGSSYSVTVAAQPSGPSQTCTVSQGTGTVAGQDVGSVAVSCVTDRFAVGGTVSGLVGTGLVLRLNGGQDLAISADGSFVFPQQLEDGSSYSVTVAAQPASPDQICTVAQGTGTLAGADVTDVAVSCVNAYSVGGSVSGLKGSGLVLQLNGAQDLNVTADGPFTFPQKLADGSSYQVTVAAQPAGPSQTCTLANASGTLSGADVSDVALSCYDDPTVTGLALFEDLDEDGAASTGDRITLRFTANLALNGPTAADLALPVSGDDAGSGATVGAGAAADQVRLTLGSAPVLKVRGTFSPSATSPGSPSGIDVSASMSPDAIEHALSGGDAVPSQAVDLIPAFHGPTQVLSSASRPAAALGDLDGDGDIDLVTAGLDGSGSASGSVPTEVWLNDGSGTFTKAQSITGYDVRALALGDLDGDGDLDLVLGVERDAAGTSSANRIYLNDGSGAFADSGLALGSAETFGVAVGDLDGDGKLDLFFGNYGDSNPPDEVWFNASSGGSLQFTASTQAFPNRSTSAVAIGDLDGDGDLDLVLGFGRNSYPSTGPDTVWLNDGNGWFTDTGQSLGNGRTIQLALGDLDGDGDLDLVQLHDGSRADYAYLNDGNGQFGSPVQVADTTMDTKGLAVGDVDGDGDLDLLVTDYGPSADSRVYLNDGTGQAFVDSGQRLTGTFSTYAMLGDLDGDGDLDAVLVGYYGSGTTQVFKGSAAVP